MKEPILAKILRYWTYAAAFVPLIIFNEYISPFHFGKVVIFRSLIYIGLVFFILLIWKDRSYLPKFNKVTWSFFAFACAFTVATMFSIIPYMSMWGSLERMGGLFTFWHYFIYFLIITSVFRTERDWVNLFNVVISVGVLSAFYGFLQKTDLQWVVGSGGRERIFGTIGNTALFAGYQILCAFLSFTLFFRKDNSDGYRIFYGISGVIMAIATFMTAVRGSLLGIVIGFIAFALLYSSVYRSKQAKKILLGLIGLVFVFIVLGLLFKNTDFIQQNRFLRRVTNFDIKDYTVQTRFWAWEAGLKGWSEGPKTILVGWGPENFNIPFSKYFNPKFYQGPGSETLFDRAHNMFVEILVTMGLLGLLTYLGIFAMSFKTLWSKLTSKEYSTYSVGLISLLVAYAIHNSFIFDTSANFLTFFTILGFIAFIGMPKAPAEANGKKKDVRPRKVSPGLFVFASMILFIVCCVAIYEFNVLPSEANYATTRGIILGWSSDFAGAVKKFQEAISYEGPGKYEYRNRFAQYVIESSNSGKLNQEHIDAINLALAEMQKNIDENEMDYLPYLYAARLNIILGKGDQDSPYNKKALDLSLKTIEISPTFVRSYYEIGQAYLNMGDLDNASKYFQKASELNPDVGLSKWYWGVIELEKGNIDEGLTIIEEIIKSGKYSPGESDLGRLNNVYVARNDYPKIAWVYEMLVNLAPNNGQYHASLAVAYARIGRYEDAVKQAREAAKVDPKFEPEARAFVESLGAKW
jgi:tetratricopeptide (TPR) repeat protein/O-antigen ligase